MKFKHIIWDYNGTILDDVNICVDIFKQMFIEHNIDHSSFDSVKYKEIFGFPIVNCYAEFGFDFDKKSFASLSNEFIENYYKRSDEHVIKDGLLEIFEYVLQSCSTQSILSASVKEKISAQLDYFNISKYFTHVSGLDNNQAKGKDNLIPQHLSKINADVQDILLIGDTDHDLLVANKIGCSCVLVSYGHQSAKRLMNVHTHVVTGSNELLEYIKQ